MTEIIEALNMLEKEKNIEKAVMIDSIEKAIVSACERDFGKDAVVAHMDPETGEITVTAPKQVVDEINDPNTDILIEDARHIDPDCEINDFIQCEIKTLDFGRIAAQKARGIILQNIKEGERKAVYDYFKDRERTIMTGVVQRYVGYNLSINLGGKTDAILSSREMIPGEKYRPGDRIKVYIVGVKENQKGGFRIVTSRTHPEFVKKLFEREVSEIADGTVEIMSISREAGSRSKLAVWSNDSDVDAVGACVGLNSQRINNIVDDLCGEKIDVIEWDEDPAIFIENALRPSPVISVEVDEENRMARVVVPDEKLSLAIGKEGQNARLAARLTDYKIDIKSESQAEEDDEYYDDEYDEEEYEEYDDEEIDDEAIAEAAEELAEEEADEAAADEADDTEVTDEDDSEDEATEE
ncbi:MAG: transcription termination/antitermination protein NusA [Eubacterium sp.]|nr:transcription termination/antitermination protein NusA [Eubacterium sp.]